MIVTRQNRIPFSWVVMAMLPWALFYFQITVSGVNFFIIKRFIDNPASLTFVISLPGILFSIIPIGPFISFMSDRIWTRWGRRKIFVIMGFSGWSVVLFCYPLAPNIWFFIALTFVFALFGTLNAPLEALKQEIIPPPMRGRSAALWTWIVNILNVTFWMIVIGRLDEVVRFAGVSLSGDKILYWSAAAGLMIAVFIYFFGVHEVNPRSNITGQHFNLKTAWRALTMPELRYLYLLLFATSMLNAGLGAMGFLLYTEQWGYSLQEMGFNIAVGGVLNLVLIPIIGIFADKGSRMRIYLTCLGIILALNVAYFTYVTWILPDQRPSLFEIIFFGETTCIFGIIAGMVYYPLVYDYIQRNLLGTYFAGAGILGSIFGFITLNGLGLFLLGWANLFQPPAGEMVRVCVNGSRTRAEVEQILHSTPLKTPDGPVAELRQITARPWYADGIVNDAGTCFEIRLKDPVTETKRKRRDELKNETAGLEAKIKMDRSRGAPTQKLEEKLNAEQVEFKTLEETLAARAIAWRDEVVRVLGDQIMRPGTELLGTTTISAVVAVVPTTRKPDPKNLERFNRLLRLEDANAIDLQIVRREHGFGLSVGARIPTGSNAQVTLRDLRQHLLTLGAEVAPGLLVNDPVFEQIAIQPAVMMDLALVENPVKTFVSPITRGVNFVLSPFTEPPPPDFKLHSLARLLCKGDSISHARVDTLPDRHGLRIIAVAATNPAPDQVAWITGISAKARKEATDLRLTVPTPVVAKDAVPIKYNYMVSYIYVFFMVLCGFGLIAYFIRQEKRGKIHKLGAEEAHAEKNAAAKAEADHQAAVAAGQTPVSRAGVTYIPGYLLPKLLLTFVGLLVVTTAVRTAWPDFRLVLIGRRTEATAVAVIARKTGQPDIRLESESAIKAKCAAVAEAKDYKWIFYTEFAYETQDSKTVTFVRNLGCKLKPSIPLLDDNGLPTTVTIFADPQGRAMPVLPLEYSSWFAPGLVGCIGLCALFVGVMLSWTARRPIPLNEDPAISAAAEPAKD